MCSSLLLMQAYESDSESRSLLLIAILLVIVRNSLRVRVRPPRIISLLGVSVSWPSLPVNLTLNSLFYILEV